MEFIGPVAKLPCQADYLTDDEFSHTSRVTKGRVEDSDAVRCGVLDVDLICPYTEAADDYQAFSLPENASSEHRLWSYANDMYITNDMLDVIPEFVSEGVWLHRIFSMRASSDKEVFNASTW